MQSEMGVVAKEKMTGEAFLSGRAREAELRKIRSERILASEGLLFRTDLQVFPLSGNIELRSKTEIAYRALCLLIVAMRADRLEQTMALRVIRQYGLASHFSPREKEFIRSAEPTDHERSVFLWRYESAWVLLWAMGFIDVLASPDRICQTDRAVVCMRDRNTKSFLNYATLRPDSQILDQADLIYRYHASIIDADQDQRTIRAGLVADVVYERRHALNWLVRYTDDDWDDVRIGG